ncbi:PspC domain-containing protein [Paenibacillus sp. P96]|uniref:PspC domain-containing protein n=1 Tax=Paenibacillus zeirhizosphaerae TaxID=2987519 RepID=A0ABT9FV89_9BACL|nr:PspC domain-containing protein [Paenibacillus sp. P96]MDP4098382.1 PspC domain-containing protein [Paenibacillus sp. P96]
MTKLYRSSRDRMITGVSGGLSDVVGIDSTWVRILLLISIPFTGGATILIYFIAALVIPKEPHPPHNGYGHPGGSFQQGYNSGPYGGQYGREQHQQNYGAGQGFNNGYGQQSSFGSKGSDLDSMMEDIEKKAMKKELAELRKKIAELEKGERKNGNL